MTTKPQPGRDRHTLPPFSHPQTVVRGLPLARGGAGPKNGSGPHPDPPRRTDMAVFPSARTCFRVILLGTAVLSYVVSWSAESKALPGGADAWHAAGVRGRGVKVAVLDTGFRGYRDHLGRELPATVKVKSFRHDADLEARDSNHGVACAEVIHTLAPDAELLFANWEPDHPETFLAAVAW